MFDSWFGHKSLLNTGNVKFFVTFFCIFFVDFEIKI